MKIFCLLLVLFGQNCHALTLSEIRSDVRSLITDAQATRQRFTNTELDFWINEGQKIADVKTTCIYKSTTFQLSAGTTYYQMPEGFLAIRRVTRDKLSIQEMTPAGLDGRSAEWENASGYPTYYFINFSSRTQIGFAPFPNVVADTATIVVDYFTYSDTLVDASVPFNGNQDLIPFNYALVFYGAYMASIIDERYDKAKIFMDSFTSVTDLMKTSCTLRPNYLPSGIGKQ
jgi:hypothetical protein